MRALNLLGLLFLALTTTSALADEKLVCNEFDSKTEKLLQRTIVLYHTDNKKVVEGVPANYSLEVFQGADFSPEISTKGTVMTEDVSFAFESKDKKVSFHVYLDEMNEVSLTIDGKDQGHFFCR